MPVYVVIDFETAGHKADSACALAMVKVVDGVIADEFFSLIKPPASDFSFSWLHGITWPMVEFAPSFADNWRNISAFMVGASFLVAHNAAFDRRVLRACCQGALLPTPVLPFLCTLKGARRALGLPSYRLNVICRHLGIDLIHHQAASDARAAAKLLLHLHGMGLDDGQMRLGGV